MDTVLSGIRSTGNLHLGSTSVRYATSSGCRTKTGVLLLPIFTHSPHTPTRKIYTGTLKMYWSITWPRALIPVNRSSIYKVTCRKRSGYLYLNMHAYMGERQNPSFKEKARKQLRT